MKLIENFKKISTIDKSIIIFSILIFIFLSINVIAGIVHTFDYNQRKDSGNQRWLQVENRILQYEQKIDDLETKVENLTKEVK